MFSNQSSLKIEADPNIDLKLLKQIIYSKEKLYKKL